MLPALQSDFVGYIPNTHYQRGAPYGAATRAAAAKRNQRVLPQPGTEELAAARAERVRRRAEAGGVMLPGRYKRVAIKQQQGVRFEEFDFSYYNRTPFTGLENDLANCYTNALLQARLLRCLLVALPGCPHAACPCCTAAAGFFSFEAGPACCDVAGVSFCGLFSIVAATLLPCSPRRCCSSLQPPATRCCSMCLTPQPS